MSSVGNFKQPLNNPEWFNPGAALFIVPSPNLNLGYCLFGVLRSHRYYVEFLRVIWSPDQKKPDNLIGCVNLPLNVNGPRFHSRCVPMQFSRDRPVPGFHTIPNNSEFLKIRWCSNFYQKTQTCNWWMARHLLINAPFKYKQSNTLSPLSYGQGRTLFSHPEILA